MSNPIANLQRANSDNQSEWLRLAQSIGLITKSAQWRSEQNLYTGVLWLTGNWDSIEYAMRVHSLDELREIHRLMHRRENAA